MTLATMPPEQNDSEAHVVHEARIVGTSDLHTFNFAFDNLSPTRAYQLTVHFDPLTGHTGSGPCPKVTWIGPKGGVFVPNPKQLLDLKGFALTTQIEVETHQSNAVAFAGADALDFSRSVRAFHWRSDVPGVTSAELQIAADKFQSSNETPKTCGSPSGLLQRVPLTWHSGWNSTDAIDFDQLVLSQPNPRSPGLNQPQASQLSPIQKSLAHGAPIYVRVVPIGANGLYLCDPSPL
jgi:hypothetical protein